MEKEKNEYLISEEIDKWSKNNINSQYERLKNLDTKRKFIYSNSTESLYANLITAIKDCYNFMLKKQLNYKEFCDDVDKINNTQNYPFHKDKILFGFTPKILSAIGYQELPLYMTSEHLYTCIKENGFIQGDNIHYHNLSANLIKTLPFLLPNAFLIAKSNTYPDNLISFIDYPIKDINGKDVPLLTIYNPSGSISFERIKLQSNKLTSIYGKDDVQKWINNFNLSQILYLNKKISQQYQLTTPLDNSVAGLVQPSGFYINNINQYIQKVNLIQNHRKLVPNTKKILLANKAIASDADCDINTILHEPMIPNFTQITPTISEEVENFEQKPIGILNIVGKRFDVDEKGTPTFEGLKSLSKAMQIYSDKHYETARYLFIKNGQIVRHVTVSSQTPSSTTIKPDENFLYSLRNYAEETESKIVFLHNHPSGYVEPSEADIKLTNYLANFFTINGESIFSGHIILDHGTYGLYTEKTREWGALINGELKPLIELRANIGINFPADTKIASFNPDFSISTQSLIELSEYAKECDDVGTWNTKDWVPCLLLSSNGIVTNFDVIKNHEFENINILSNKLKQLGREFGSENIILFPRTSKQFLITERFAQLTRKIKDIYFEKDDGTFELSQFPNGNIFNDLTRGDIKIVDSENYVEEVKVKIASENKKDIENRKQHYLDTVTSLENLNPLIQSETIDKSNDIFVQNQKESFKDGDEISIDNGVAWEYDEHHNRILKENDSFHIDGVEVDKNTQEFNQKSEQENKTDLSKVIFEKYIHSEELHSALKDALKEVAVPLKKIEFTKENYNKLFPRSRIETPIESVKMGANQFEKLEEKERKNLLLAVHDTLKNPDLIINEQKENVFGENEDNHIYAKSFLIGDKVHGVKSVVVSIDGENVSISTHERSLNNIVNKIKKPDQLLYAAAKVRLLVEQHTKEELPQLMVNPIRENEYVVSPQSNLHQNSESVKQEYKGNEIMKNEMNQESELNIGENGNEILYDGLESETGRRRSIKAIDVWNEIYENIAENPEYEAIKFETLDYLYNKGTDDAAGYDNSFERNINRLEEISKSDKQLESILKKYKDCKIDFDDKALTVKIAGTRNNNFNKAKQDLLDFVENKKYLRESEINQKQGLSLFDKELYLFNNGQLDENHVFNLGKPGEILKNCGFPENDRIELVASRLKIKASQGNHPFEIMDILGLDKALQNPIAVFEYGEKEKAQNVIVNLEKDGKNFLVGVFFNQKKDGFEVSSIRGLFNRDNLDWMRWIQQGKMIYGDKERIQVLANQQRTNLADVNSKEARTLSDLYYLDSLDNILQNFAGVKNIYTRDFPRYTEQKEKFEIFKQFRSAYQETDSINIYDAVKDADEFYKAIKNNDKSIIEKFTNGIEKAELASVASLILENGGSHVQLKDINTQALNQNLHQNSESVKQELKGNKTMKNENSKSSEQENKLTKEQAAKAVSLVSKQGFSQNNQEEIAIMFNKLKAVNSIAEKNNEPIIALDFENPILISEAQIFAFDKNITEENKSKINELPYAVITVPDKDIEEGEEQTFHQEKYYLLDSLPNKNVILNQNQENKIDLSKVIVFDTETTGVKAGEDELLQISIIDGNGKELFNKYVKPEHKTSWEDAEKINGISPNSVKDCPSVKEYVSEIESILNNAELFMSYNGNFDVKFLEAAGIRVPNTPHLDIMKPAASITKFPARKNDNRAIDGYHYPRLVDVSEKIGFNYKAHDSLGDTTATLEVAKNLYGKNLEKLTPEIIQKYSPFIQKENVGASLASLGINISQSKEKSNIVSKDEPQREDSISQTEEELRKKLAAAEKKIEALKKKLEETLGQNNNLQRENSAIKDATQVKDNTPANENQAISKANQIQDSPCRQRNNDIDTKNFSKENAFLTNTLIPKFGLKGDDGKIRIIEGAVFKKQLLDEKDPSANKILLEIQKEDGTSEEIKISEFKYQEIINGIERLNKFKEDMGNKQTLGDWFKAHADYNQALLLDEFKLRENTAGNFIHNFKARCLLDARNRDEAIKIAARMVKDMDHKERKRFNKDRKEKGAEEFDNILIDIFDEIHAQKELAIKDVDIFYDVSLSNNSLERGLAEENRDLNEMKTGDLIPGCEKFKVGDTVPISITTKGFDGKQRKTPKADFKIARVSKNVNPPRALIFNEKTKAMYLISLVDLKEHLKKIERNQLKERKKTAERDYKQAGYDGPCY